MRLYQGSASEFMEATDANEVVPVMEAAFRHHQGRTPSSQELRSWQNSLPRFAGVVRLAGLADHQIMLEYQLPRNSKRLDAFVVGEDGPQAGRAYIVELKQWETCIPSEGDEVVTWVAGGNRSVPHPSVQVNNYQRYLEDCIETFHENQVRLRSCAYLHNYALQDDDVLRAPQFESLLVKSPVYDSTTARALATDLVEWVPFAPDESIVDAVLNPKLKPSKKLMDAVARSVRGQEAYILLGNQITAMNEIVMAARRARRLQTDCAILVNGGPGTGKSAVAVQALGRLAKEDLRVNLSFGNASMYQAVSRALEPSARNAITKFWNYRGQTDRHLDVLLCDEAHRIRESSNLQFTPKAQRTDMRQIDEVFAVAHVPVFFIDDLQTVRKTDVGSRQLVFDEAADRGIDVVEIELDSQFRCAGSDAFVNWVGDVLGIHESAHPTWQTDEEFDFRLLDSPHELRDLIQKRHQQGHRARIMAGFCWPWSKTLEPTGYLVNDVKIGDFEMPWNAHPSARGLTRDIPKDTDWAHHPGGVDQIGCIYTAQGFEFDYAGVIWGKDLVYDSTKKRLVAKKEGSKDSVLKRSGEDFDRYVRQVYRVLLTRGMKGCYLYIEDEATREYVRGRIEIQ